MAYSLNVNGRTLRADVDGDTPVLWVLRESLGLTGTKFGCGAALCGACTIHVNGEAWRSCITPVDSVGPRRITTIEELDKESGGRTGSGPQHRLYESPQRNEQRRNGNAHLGMNDSAVDGERKCTGLGRSARAAKKKLFEDGSHFGLVLPDDIENLGVCGTEFYRGIYEGTASVVRPAPPLFEGGKQGSCR